MKSGKPVEGIVVCGLNGVGKSTLGRALAEALGYDFFDIEEYFFPGRQPDKPYLSPRTGEEVNAALLADIARSKGFVLASVRAHYSPELEKSFTAALLLEAPPQVRARRMRERSYRKFGERMLPGGDLYDSEEEFFAMAAGREPSLVENWLKKLAIPVLRLDGEAPVEVNIQHFLQS